MQITRIQTMPVQPRWLFVKVETDEGLVGYGECLGDKAFVNAEAVRSFEHYLIGQDPRRIVHHWQAMYRGAFWRGGPNLNAAISGLEMAMWDILGKALGVPVYQLLGGAVRDRIRVYSHLGGRTPEEMARNAREYVAKGYTAMKFCPTERVRIVDHYQVVEEAAARVQAVREAVGTGVDILLDFHGRISPAMAVWLEEAIRPYHPMFIEEPALPENVEAMARIAPQFKTPIATGERLFTKWGFREVLEKGAASILQPDPCICGGIFETRQIGAMAETWYAALAPHNPYGPVNFAACLQIDACTPNFLIQEFVYPTALGAGYLKEPFVVEDGHIALPTQPGLGIELDEEWIAAHALSPLPDIGRWFHPSDGSVADW
ncbi:MAG TPA: galactonate dehydratase [Chthonomonadaceae bacterium]|nr:galactonate dehydratase [Chthonomonadaceae bacterium]